MASGKILFVSQPTSDVSHPKAVSPAQPNDRLQRIAPWPGTQRARNGLSLSFDTALIPISQNSGNLSVLNLRVSPLGSRRPGAVFPCAASIIEASNPAGT